MSYSKKEAAMTYTTLLQTIEQWNIPNRISQKYSVWQLRYKQPKLSSDWVALIFHSLTFYILKNLPWLVSDHRHHFTLTHSEAIKHHYSQIILKKPSLFDLKIVVLVKIVTYFIGSQFPHTKADEQLEADIYRLIMKNLIGKKTYDLGLDVEEKAFKIFMKGLKCREDKRKRDSIDEELKNEDHLFKNLPFYKDLGQSKHKLSDPNVGTMKSISRRNARKHNETYGKLWEIKQSHTKLQQLKHALKENLHVKPLPKPKTPTYGVNQLKRLYKMQLKQISSNIPQNQAIFTLNCGKNQTEGEDLLVKKGKFEQICSAIENKGQILDAQSHYEGNSSEKQHKYRKNKIDTNQLSHAFCAKTDLKLINTKNYSINHSPHKQLRDSLNCISLPSIISKPRKQQNQAIPNISKTSTKPKQQLQNITDNSFIDPQKIKRYASFIPQRSGDKWMRYITEMKEGCYHLNKENQKKKIIDYEQKYSDVLNIEGGLRFMTEGQDKTANEARPTNKESVISSSLAQTKHTINNDPFSQSIRQQHQGHLTKAIKKADSKKLEQHTTSLPSIMNTIIGKAFNQRDINCTVIDDSSLKTKKINKKGNRLSSMPNRDESSCEVSFCRKQIGGQNFMNRIQAL